MNRRDIIITAVLINAGLLIVLFISSLKSHDPTELVMAKEVVEKKIAPAPAKKVAAPTAPKVAKTPLDQALAAHKVPEAQPEIKKEKPKKPVVASTPKEETLAVVEVKSGDALEKIARRYHVEVEELMRVNHLTSARLQIGQKLKVPEAKKVVEEKKVASQSNGEYYIMRHGDNLWNIARENHIKFDDLLELNDLNEEKSRRLKPGARIRIK